MSISNLQVTPTAATFTVAGTPQIVAVVYQKKGSTAWLTAGQLVNPAAGATTVTLPNLSPGDEVAVGDATPSDWVEKAIPTPTPPPPPPPPRSSMVVAVDTSGWPGNLHDELTAGGILNRRVNTPTVIAEVKAKGGKVTTLTLHAGYPLNFTPATFAAEAVKVCQEHPELESLEPLNEPELSWYANGKSAVATARFVEILKACREGFDAHGIKTKLIASWAPEYGFGQAWGPAGLKYVDGVVVHAYGGSTGQHGGLTGARDLIAQARKETGKPVYVTEVGWPTAVGKGSTGDSQQWSEAQQAQAITDFAAWARSTGYVALFVYFNAVDYGTNNYYGIERANRSHKPSFAALAKAAA